MMPPLTTPAGGEKSYANSCAYRTSKKQVVGGKSQQQPTKQYKSGPVYPTVLALERSRRQMTLLAAQTSLAPGLLHSCRQLRPRARFQIVEAPKLPGK